MDSSPQTTTRPYLHKHFLVRLKNLSSPWLHFFYSLSRAAIDSPRNANNFGYDSFFVNWSREIASNKDRALFI